MFAIGKDFQKGDLCTSLAEACELQTRYRSKRATGKRTLGQRQAVGCYKQWVSAQSPASAAVGKLVALLTVQAS